MSAGNYDTKFVWLKYSATRDVYGGVIKVFTDNGELWGSIQDISGAEKISYGYLQSTVDCKICIRNLPALDSKDRLQNKETEQTYSIDGIVRAKNELICTCSSKVVL